MFSLKRSLIASLVALLFYVFFMILGDVLLSQQKTFLETTFEKQFPGVKLSLGRLYNLPFVFVGAKDVTLSFGNQNEITIKNVRIFYLPSFLWEGTQAIYQITFQETKGVLVPNELLAYLHSLPHLFSTHRHPLPRIVMKKGEVLFSFWQTLFATCSFSEAVFHPHSLGWKAAYEGTVHVKDIYNMEYFQSTGSIKLHLYGTHWWETIIQSQLHLSVGGIPLSLFTNFQVDLSLYRKEDLVRTNTQENLRIDFSEKTLSYSQTLFFTYGKLQEKGIFEYYFSPGKYTLETSWKQPLSSLNFSLRGPEKQFLSLAWQPDRGSVEMYGKKGGKLSFSWKFLPQEFSLQGSADSFMVIPNFLFLTGKASLQASQNQGMLNIQDLWVNRGKVGNALIRFQIQTNGISFQKAGGNLGFDGFLGNNITVNFDGTAIQGKALTTTIWFDGLNIAKMSLATKGRFVMDSRGKILIKGSIQGNLSDKGFVSRASSEYLIETLSPTNSHVRLSNLFFSRENIRGHLTIDVLYPERRWTYVTLQGNGRFPFLGQSPLNLQYTWDALIEKGYGVLSLDKNLDCTFRHGLDEGEITWHIPEIPLSLPLKLSSSVKSSGTLRWKNHTLSFLKTTTTLVVENLPYELRLEGEKDKNNLVLRTFWLGLQGDTLIGQGEFTQKPEGGELRIGFIRGGGILLRWQKDAWESILDFKKVGIRLPEKHLVFFEGVGKLSGEGMSFDGEGQIKISDSTHTLVIRNLRKEKNHLDLKEVVFTWQGWEMRGDGFIDLETHYAGWNASLTSEDKRLCQLSLFGSLEKKENSYLISYRIPEWLLFQKKQPPLTGEIIIEKNFLTFTKKQLYGINGSYNLSTKNLSIEYLFPFMSGSLVGELSENVLNIKSEHRLGLSFLDKWQQLRITGALFARIQLSGTLSDPSLEGNIQIQGLSLSFPGIITRITNQYLTLSLSGEEIILPRQKITTSTGNFWIQGGIKPFQEGLFSLRLASQRSSDVIRFQHALFTGSLQPEILALTGNYNSLALQGNVRLRQSRLWVSLQEIWQKEKDIFPIPIQLSLVLFLDQKVHVQSELFDFVFEPGGTLKIKGPLSSPLITGKLLVASGSLRYLTQTFQVLEGSVTFENESFPTVELQSKYKYRDIQENIDIYLTFRGKLPTINLVNFYSIPERKQEEIIAYLGLPRVSTNTNVMPKTAQALLSTGAGLAEDILVLSPLSARLRQQLGLDMFVIRSTLAQNYTRYLTGGISNLSWNTLLEGSSLAIGRYILPNIFLEADISLKGQEQSNTLRLRPVYSVGISYSFEGFELGWSYEPWSDPSFLQEFYYEQKIEINYKRRF
ncbi:MAG: translocation/assembly module TamB domain-containing protein [Brevinematales bacterium]|nr:translocation/assembly module TamB domain-containing protein [Brevinematales bacterium]